MAEKEIPEALSSLFEAVLSYQDTQEGLSRVRSLAQSVFGNNWREKLPGILVDCPEHLQQQVKKNVDRALTYEKAGAVWTEVSRLLSQQFDVQQVKAQLPDMQRWLSIFGKAGQDLIAKLQNKIAQLENNTSAATGAVSASDMYGLTAEQMWIADRRIW